MKNHLQPTKFIQSLQLLTTEEFKSFCKWLQSPWSNSNKILCDLYILLQKHHPDFDAKSLTKENLFAKLYPNKKYDDKWMRNIMAAMTKQVERFLVHQRLEKDEIFAKQILAKELMERRRNDWFEKQAHNIIQVLEAKEVKETEDYLALALIHDELYHQSKVVQSHSALQISELYLDTFYSITKWRHLTELMERQMILPEEGQLSDKMEQLSALTKGLDIPVLAIYRDRINNGNGLQKGDYLQLKEKYFSLYHQIPLWDRQLLYFYFINTVIRFWMKGDQEIIYELFQLYKTGMENELLVHYGRLSEATYANILTTANSIGEFEYSKTFIEKYTELLPIENREDGKRWAMAQWHYNQKQFDQCIELLSNHLFNENMFIRYSKFLLLQCYFDACISDDSYYLFFYDYCEASKKYFKRNKSLSIERNMAYINIIKYAHKCIKMINEGTASRAGFQLLIESLDNEKNIQGKKWLTNKIIEIKEGLPL